VFPATTLPNADAAKAEGVDIFAIGVGGNVNTVEVEGIASEPAKNFSFHVNDYESLSLITGAIVQGTCNSASEFVCGAWQVQTPCSVSCGGGGSQTWKRTCTETNSQGSTDFDLTEERTCGDDKCPTTTVAPVDPLDCTYCQSRNGIGFLPDPEDCHRYYVCEKQPDGNYKRYRMCCGGNTYWSQEILTCVKDAPATGCVRVAQSECAAAQDVTTTPAAPACPFKAVQGDDSSYMWMTYRMPCPAGTVFSSSACGCILGANLPSVDACEQDPFLYFPFDSHFNDVSCNHAASDNVGNVVNRWGKVGNSAFFDGKSRLEVPFIRNWFANKAEDKFSIALWFIRKFGDGLVGLVNNGDCATPSFEVIVEDTNKVTGSMDTFGAAVNYKQLQSIKINNDEWYHVALVYDGENLSFYLNGEKKQNSEALQGYIENRDCPMQIGHSGDEANGSYFQGQIDDLRVYRRALTKSEVTDLYDMGA